MKRYWMFKVTMMTILIIGFAVVAVVVVALLWNALVPEIFGGTQITWVRALGLLVLARLLVGSGRHGGFGGRRRWRDHWTRKVANMNPEELEKWKAEVSRCCRGGPSDVDTRQADRQDPLEA